MDSTFSYCNNNEGLLKLTDGHMHYTVAKYLLNSTR